MKYPDARRCAVGLITGVAVSALAIGWSTQAMAQSAASPAAAQSSQAGSEAAPERGGLEEIVVEARRISENLQQVPISVGILNTAALESRQITGVMDLKGSVAGLTTSRSATPGAGYITIRGVTAAALPSPAIDSGVGFYIDGVYIARQQGSGVDIPDLANVEVLRGPQGTLFGRNSTAGAINFITNAPSDRLEFKLSALYGNYDTLRASAMVNLPITDTLAVRATYQHVQQDGDVINTSRSPGYIFNGYAEMTPAKTLGASNSEGISVRVRFTGIENLTADYKFDHQDFIESSPASQLLGFLPTPLTLGGLVGLYPIQAPGTVLQSFTRLGSLAHDIAGLGPIKATGHLVTLDYRLSDTLSVKSLTAWRKTRNDIFSDLDGGDWRVPLPPTFTSSLPFCVVCSYVAQKQQQFSEEGQLIGKYGAFNFILGGYYFVEHSSFTSIFLAGSVLPERPATYTPPTVAFVQVAPGVFAPGPFAIGAMGRFVNRSFAGYGHADYDLSDQLKLAVGARYTVDKRRTNDDRSFAAFPLSTVTYKRVTYDAALNYQITPDQLIYAKYGKGYISGGVVNGLPFKPETQKQAEIGFKGEFLDRRLRVNASAYYTWITDRQSAVANLDPTFNPTLAGAGFSPPYPLGAVQYNLPGTSTVKGFEIETTLVPADGLTLTANFGYNSPEFSDNSLQRAPKTTFAFSGQYDFPHFANDSYVSFRVDGDYRGSYYGSGLDAPDTFSGNVPAALRPGFATSAKYLAALQQASIAGDYWLVNARLSLVDLPFFGGAKAKISGFVRNIFDEQGLLYTVNYGIGVNGAFERPRTYGAEVTMSF